MVQALTELEECVDLLDEIDMDRERNKLKDYIPYGLLPEHNRGTPDWDWQLRFHNDGAVKHVRMVSTGNQEGKTLIGGHEDAYHLTGRYPKWWKGARYDRPIYLWACGVDNEKVRDSLQDLLIGDPDDPDSFGTGLIPAECLDRNRVVSKPQVAGAFQRVYVKHVTGGWSKLDFKAYKQGKDAFMTKGVDVIHLDEEPPQDIFSSCVVRGVARPDRPLIYITCTPEKGLTPLQMQFRNDLQPHQSYINSSWDDCPHLTPERQAIILSSIPPHERDMRSKGIPIIGTGVVYPIPDEAITCEMFKIPDHFYCICGMDFGSWNHPTAMAWIAWDRQNDIIYVYDCYKEEKREPATHAMALKAGRKRYIPVSWPHDANKADRKTGIGLAQEYRESYECNMLHTWATNPPADGVEEGKGGNSVDVGLVNIYNRMMEGRFKVFSHLSKWFNEKATYHTKDGKVVRFNEDIMSATRYAVMMLRFSEPMVVKERGMSVECEMGYEPGIY